MKYLLVSSLSFFLDPKSGNELRSNFRNLFVCAWSSSGCKAKVESKIQNVPSANDFNHAEKRERWFFKILRLFRLLPTVDRGKEYRNLWVLERCSKVLKSQLPSKWSSLNQSQLSKPTLTGRNENAKPPFRCSRLVCNIGYFSQWSNDVTLLGSDSLDPK